MKVLITQFPQLSQTLKPAGISHSIFSQEDNETSVMSSYPVGVVVGEELDVRRHHHSMNKYVSEQKCLH